MTIRFKTNIRTSSALSDRIRAGLSVLAFAFACLPIASCGSHLSLASRGVRVPAAPRAAARHSTASRRVAPAAEQVPMPVAKCRLAEHHVAVDSLALAESELREALALDPGYAPALSLLSKLYYESGRYSQGIALLEPVLSRPNAFGEEARRALLSGLALHQDALGRTDLARATLASARLAGGDETESADVYVMLRGDAPDSATALAREVLRREGKSAVNLNNFGITRLRAGDLDAAQRAFKSAIDLDPTLPGPYYNLAIMEKFYRFNDTSATRWFGEYWTRSHADPDSLRAVFPAGLATVPRPQGDRP